MKIIKQMLCLITAAVMSVSMLTGVQALAGNPYKDVNKGSWYYEYAVQAYELGIMKGVYYDRFAPDAPMTREMFVTALARMSDGYAYSYISPFKDVKDGKWYFNSVLWAADMDITRGVDKQTFGVGQYVTREQIATFIYRYLNNRFIAVSVPKIKNPAPAFSDIPSEFAKEAVEFMRLTGIVNGMGDNKFAPKQSVTRAQAAAMLCRLHDAVQSASYKFNLDPQRYTKIEIRKLVRDENGNIPTVKAITNKADIKRAIEYMNSIVFEDSYDIEPKDGWLYDMRLFDDSIYRPIFTATLIDSETVSGFEAGCRFYRTDKLQPFLDFINNSQ